MKRFDKFMAKAEADRAVFEAHRKAALLVSGWRALVCVCVCER